MTQNLNARAWLYRCLAPRSNRAYGLNPAADKKWCSSLNPGARISQYMRSCAFVFLCVFVTVFAFGQSAPPGKDGAMTRLQIESGTLYTRSGIPIHLSHAIARIAPGMHATGSDGHESKNGDNNKIVFLDSGRVGLSNDSLTKLMQSKVGGNGIEDLKVTTENGQVKISGKMKKVVAVPVMLEGPATATPDGKIELHTRKMKAASLPKSITDALGMNVKHVVGDKAKGVHAEDDDSLIFDPDELWGLPIHGFVRRVLVERDGLLLIFGPQPRPSGHQLAASK